MLTKFPQNVLYYPPAPRAKWSTHFPRRGKCFCCRKRKMQTFIFVTRRLKKKKFLQHLHEPRVPEADKLSQLEKRGRFSVDFKCLLLLFVPRV